MLTRLPSELFRRATALPLVRNTSVQWKMKKEPLVIEKIGGKYLISMVHGKGASLRSIDTLAELMDCLGAPLMLELQSADYTSDKEFENLVLSIRRNGIAIKGNLVPYEPSKLSSSFLVEAMNRNMLLRRTLDLHSFIIEIKSFKGLKPIMKQLDDIDVVVVRQNTEGVYTLLEHSPKPQVIELLNVITKNNSIRLAQCAFTYARRKKRKLVQCLHRADLIPLTDSKFIEGFLEVAKEYPEIEHQTITFGRAFKRFMKNKKRLDVVVINGLHGMILTNFLLGLIGGPHLTAGVNIGETAVVIEPASRIRGSEESPNPTAYFLCGAAVLDFIGHSELSDIVRESLEAVFIKKIYTKDLGGKATHEEFTAEVIKEVRKRRPHVLCR